ASQILAAADHCKDGDVEGTAIALQRLARDSSFKATRKDRRLEALLQSLQPKALPLRQLSSTCWALARLQASDGPLLAALQREASGKLHEMSSQDFSSLAWAFSRSGRFMMEQ
ncbi:unnamed protein product, partial [Effrenium voratum]